MLYYKNVSINDGSLFKIASCDESAGWNHEEIKVLKLIAKAFVENCIESIIIESFGNNGFVFKVSGMKPIFWVNPYTIDGSIRFSCFNPKWDLEEAI